MNRAISWKGLVVEQNGLKFGTLDTSNTYIMYMEYIWPCSMCSVQRHFGVLQCTLLKMACILKKTGCRVKQSEIWDSGVLAVCIWCIFDLVGFEVIWRSCSALVSKWPVSQKRLVLEWNWVKFGTLVDTSNTYIVYLWLCMVQVIWGSFGALFSKCLVSQKRLAIEWNGLKFGTQGHILNVYLVRH